MLNNTANSKFTKKAAALRENLRKRKKQQIARLNQKTNKDNHLTANKQKVENIN
ncbi:hypothetical protein HAV_00663 [Candidatus Hepatincola sp. Av]